MRRLAPAFGLFTLGLLVACVPAPKKAYAPEEAANLTDIDETMHVNAAKMDPLFSLEDQTTFDDAAWAKMTDAAKAVGQGTAVAMQKPAIAGKYPAQFVTYAKDLETHAVAMGAAAEKKDGAAAAKSIAAVHHACRACHSELR